MDVTEGPSMTKLYALRIVRVVTDSDDTQTRGIAQALEAQREGHVFIGESLREVQRALTDHIQSIRTLQLVEGHWRVEVALAETRGGRLGNFFVGPVPDLHFPEVLKEQEGMDLYV